MRFLTSKAAAASAVLIASAAMADPLTTITPCPGATGTAALPITVTAQYQAVSTCVTTSGSIRGTWVTSYPYETFAYVHTVIPAAWNGTAGTTITVTKTDQPVTVSRCQSTVASTPLARRGEVAGGWRNTTVHSPVFLTIIKDFVVTFEEIGPLAIPGYPGSGICEECAELEDHSRHQVVTVTECRTSPQGAKCLEYLETWISASAPATQSITVWPVSTSTVVPTAGVHTFTFTGIAPPRVFGGFTAAPSPYYVHVTGSYHAYETIEFVTTITKTLSWTVPFNTQPASTSKVVPWPTGPHAFPGWPRPPRVGGSDPSDNGVGGDWAGWPNWAKPVPTPSNNDPAPAASWGNWAQPVPTPSSSDPAPAASWGDWAPWTSSASTTTTTSTTTAATTTTTTTTATTTTTTTTTTTATTATTTTTTTTAPTCGPDSTTFYISVNSPGKYHRRALNYIGFSGDDGVIVDSQADAAIFCLVDGNLVSDGEWIDVDASQPYLAFEKTTVEPVGATWAIGPDGTLTLVDSEGFCVAPDSNIFILFTASPPFTCNPVTLTVVPVGGMYIFTLIDRHRMLTCDYRIHHHHHHHR